MVRPPRGNGGLASSRCSAMIPWSPTRRHWSKVQHWCYGVPWMPTIISEMMPWVLACSSAMVPWMLTQRSGNGGTLSVAKFNKGGKMLTQGSAFVPWLRGSAQRHTARLCSLVPAQSVWLPAWLNAGECSVLLSCSGQFGPVRLVASFSIAA